MSHDKHAGRGRGQRASRAAEATSRRARVRATPRAGRAVGIGVLVIAAAIAAMVLSQRSPRLRTSPAFAPADTMQITVAYTEAARLEQAGQFVASLPCYRRVGQLLPQPVRDYELLIANALAQAALESRTDVGQPVSRSSVERVAYLAEALAHLDRARTLSRTARDVAEVEVTRAQLLHIWGFPWEALLGLRVAVAADPSWTEIAQTADLYTYHLHHPAERIRGVDFDTMLEHDLPARPTPPRATRLR